MSLTNKQPNRTEVSSSLRETFPVTVQSNWHIHNFCNTCLNINTWTSQRNIVKRGEDSEHVNYNLWSLESVVKQN